MEVVAKILKKARAFIELIVLITAIVRVARRLIRFPGSKYRSIKRPKVYEAMRRKGFSKRRAAAIANSRRGRRRK